MYIKKKKTLRRTWKYCSTHAHIENNIFRGKPYRGLDIRIHELNELHCILEGQIPPVKLAIKQETYNI